MKKKNLPDKVKKRNRTKKPSASDQLGEFLKRFGDVLLEREQALNSAPPVPPKPEPEPVTNEEEHEQYRDRLICNFEDGVRRLTGK